MKQIANTNFLLCISALTEDVFAWEFLKFVFSKKATKFCEISTVDLSYVVMVKSTVEILQNVVAFSEYMNFTPQNHLLSQILVWDTL